jgi:hypothetical protein
MALKEETGDELKAKMKSGVQVLALLLQWIHVDDNTLQKHVSTFVNGAYVPDIVYHSQKEVELFLQHAKLLLRERSRGLSALIYLKRQFLY